MPRKRGNDKHGHWLESQTLSLASCAHGILRVPFLKQRHRSHSPGSRDLLVQCSLVSAPHRCGAQLSGLPSVPTWGVLVGIDRGRAHLTEAGPVWNLGLSNGQKAVPRGRISCWHICFTGWDAETQHSIAHGSWTASTLPPWEQCMEAESSTWRPSLCLKGKGNLRLQHPTDGACLAWPSDS